MQAEDLDRAAALCGQAEKMALTAQVYARRGQTHEAEQSASDTAAAAGEARLLLESLGAATPAHVPSNPVPLHLLDIDEARRLLAKVEELLPLADAVDARRGRTMRLRGHTEGCDVRVTVERLAARLRLEVHGPGVAVTGGRE